MTGLQRPREGVIIRRVGKIVTAACPCCGARLEFNRESGRIERHWAKGATQEAPDLEARAVEAAKKAGEDVDVQELMRRGQKSDDEIERTFREASKKAKEAIDRGEKPENPLDSD